MLLASVLFKSIYRHSWGVEAAEPREDRRRPGLLGRLVSAFAARFTPHLRERRPGDR